MPPKPSHKTTVKGLSQQEVNQRLKQGQVNDFVARSGRTYFTIIQQNIFSVFNLMLFTLLMIVLFTGDFITVLFAGFSVVTNSLIGTVQEIQAKRKLDELANLAPREVHVLRDGEHQTIDYRQVVLDEVIFIQPGDKLVVDGKVILSDSLEIDESHLTGESEPVNKTVDDDVSSGSFCIAGTGYMIATRIGAQSTVNQLTSLAKVYRNTLTPTQQRIAAIVKVALVVLVVFGPMSVINGITSDIGFIEVVKNSVVFMTSLVPQGLILTSILALSIGAIKISRHQTLIQRVNAVESMANASVLCFDKTGTLTHNKLVVQSVTPLGNLPENTLREQLQIYTANLSHLNSTAGAIAEYVQPDKNADYPIKDHEIPFTSARKWGAVVFNDEAWVMGAPEFLMTTDSPFHQAVNQHTQQGERVLVFAKTNQPITDDKIDTAQLEPVALIAIQDQVREDIQETLQSFIAQEVRPKVISGDNRETVIAVASQAGMNTSVAYTGAELDAMNDDVFSSAVYEADVFARVAPETKRRIIQSLQARGEYVAMVGDGVNDVPALKAAHLAIVMNDGAQIAKDVADIVLLNNAMSTLPKAFAEGVEITQTLYGTTKIFITKNVYNTCLFIFILFMGLPFPVTPRQISWAAFGTVNIPSGLMALGLLRPSKIKSFRRDVLDYIITSGFTSAIGMAFIFLVTYTHTDDLMVSRSAITLFFILYSLTVFWFVCGVDITRPSTYTKYPLATAITGFLTSGTLVFATLFPSVFEFQWPSPIIIFLVVTTWLLVSMIVSVGMRNRSLLHQLYKLTDPKTPADHQKHG